MLVAHGNMWRIESLCSWRTLSKYMVCVSWTMVLHGVYGVVFSPLKMYNEESLVNIVASTFEGDKSLSISRYK